MKFPTQKSRQIYQALLDKQTRLKVQLLDFQRQIQEYQTNYFQKHWNEGNVVLGWPKVATPPPPNNAPKIKIIGKDKIFSLSSATSKANLQLLDIADKNLTPYPQNRFQTLFAGRKERGRRVMGQFRLGRDLQEEEEDEEVPRCRPLHSFLSYDLRCRLQMTIFYFIMFLWFNLRSKLKRNIYELKKQQVKYQQNLISILIQKISVNKFGFNFNKKHSYGLAQVVTMLIKSAEKKLTINNEQGSKEYSLLLQAFNRFQQDDLSKSQPVYSRNNPINYLFIAYFPNSLRILSTFAYQVRSAEIGIENRNGIFLLPRKIYIFQFCMLFWQLASNQITLAIRGQIDIQYDKDNTPFQNNFYTFKSCIYRGLFYRHYGLFAHWSINHQQTRLQKATDKHMAEGIRVYQS